MLSQVMSALAAEYSLNPASDGSMCGIYTGYAFSLAKAQAKGCILFTAWIDKTAGASEIANVHLEAYSQKPENSFVTVYRVTDGEIFAALFCSENAKENISRFINELFLTLNYNYIVPACNVCGKKSELCFAPLAQNGKFKLMCKTCSKAQAEKRAAQNQQEKAENITSFNMQNPPQYTGDMQSAAVPTAYSAGDYAQNTASMQYQRPVNAVTELERQNQFNPGYQPRVDAMPYVSGNGVPQPVSGYAPASAEDYAQRYGGYMVRASGPEKPRTLAGIIGALLFSIIGCVIWVLIAGDGITEYLAPTIPAFALVLGYMAFGKRLAGGGFVALLAIIAAEVFLGNMGVWAVMLSSSQDVVNILQTESIDFFTAFFNLFDIIGELDASSLSHKLSFTFSGHFAVDLAISYLIAVGSYLIMGLYCLVTGRK